MYEAIVNVRPNEDYSLSVLFEDGMQGVLDMTPYLDCGVFKRVRDFKEFQRVRIAFDTIEWECGMDLDPAFTCAGCRMLEKT